MKARVTLAGLITPETPNPASERLDQLSPLEIVRLMNAEDAKVAPGGGAGGREKCAGKIEVIANRLAAGGRPFTCGRGNVRTARGDRRRRVPANV